MHKVREQFRRASTISVSTYNSENPSRQDRMPSLAEEGQNGRPNGTSERTPLLQRANPDRYARYTEDERAWVRYPMSFLITTWKVLASNYVNVLLFAVPFGLISGNMGWDPVATFVINFVAIIPLAGLLSFATEELSAKAGQTLGGLLNATFGNAVELIVSIVALTRNEVRIVQASMLGSILSNILLVLGCCFVAGGAVHREQSFNSTVASTMSSLMAVASASLVIPATLYAVIEGNGHSENDILILSHGTSIILLILYILYLVFQLKTHASLFDEEAQSEEEDEEDHILGLYSSVVALVLVTILVSFCAEYLVGAIEPIVEKTGMSKTFIGLILIPIVGNAAEHVTAVVVAYKNKMDLAINVAIGSSMQIALFVTPFMVLVGWGIGVNMSLHFQLFETVVFFLSVLVVNYLIQDGKSNYLEGAMCLGMYAIIGLAFFIYPDDATKSGF